MKKCPRYIVVTMITIMAISVAGCCGMREFGKFVPDDNARAAFETFQIDPACRYYITGSDTYPVAILALHKSYVMGDDLWKELQLTPAGLNEMVTFMRMRLFECCYQSPHGFNVYDQQGKQIGILYSYLGVGLAFKIEDTGVVKIYGPRDDDQLKLYQQRTLH